MDNHESGIHKYMIYCEILDTPKILVKFSALKFLEDGTICDCVNVGFVTNLLRKNKGDGMLVYKFKINFKIKNLIREWIEKNANYENIDFRFIDILFLEKEYSYCSTIYSEIYVKKIE